MSWTLLPYRAQPLLLEHLLVLYRNNLHEIALEPVPVVENGLARLEPV